MAIWFDDELKLGEINAGSANCLPGELDIKFVDYGEDWIQATMPVGPKVHQPYGRLHGGASVVLAETVASVGAAMTVDPVKQGCVGMEINANHIRPVRDGLVHASGFQESAGRTTQVWTVRIVDDDGKLVCLSRVTMAVIARERG
ncbi:hotdog fold thioesterase [Altererythrobacter sp. ZODW24]|uniref:PaaI family thioesterase n=1 Tax=Altererythrobacter sp. ZODW24 TaxID=2185142 RepID=UPI000DF7355C|nr:hotdog fold thioesterase [Altererythrobacter sp. ZODW24]